MSLSLLLALGCIPDPPESARPAIVQAPPDWRAAAQTVDADLDGLARLYLEDPPAFEARADAIVKMAVLADPAFRSAVAAQGRERFLEVKDGPGDGLMDRATDAGLLVTLRGLVWPTRDFRLEDGPTVEVVPTFTPEQARARLVEELGSGTEVIRIRGSYDVAGLFAFRSTGGRPGWWLVGPRGALAPGHDGFEAAMWLAGVGRRQGAVDLPTFARLFSVFWLGREQMLASEAVALPDDADPEHAAFADYRFSDDVGATYRFTLWDVPGGGMSRWEVRVTPTGAVEAVSVAAGL